MTLDEFALWLNLKDVYWSQEGRRSIDAVIVAATVGGLVLIGLRVWFDVADDAAVAARVAVGTIVSLHLWLALVNVLKGKYPTAVAGLFATPVAIIGALRLAKPGSPWAHRYGPDKRARAEARFGHEAPTPAPRPVQAARR